MLRHLAQELRNMPFVKILIPYMVGIVAGMSFEVANSVLFYAISVFSFLFASWLLLGKQHYSRQYVAGLAVTVFFVLLGILNVNFNKPTDFPEYDREILLLARLSEPPAEKANSYKTVLETVFYQTPDSVRHPSKNLILTYIEKDSTAAQLRYGDYVLLKSTVAKVRNAGNPHEFDYKSYLFRKGVVSQTYMKARQWQPLDSNDANWLYEKAQTIRNDLINIYVEKGISGEELAVLQAITLGETSDITNEIRRSYVVSGGMHVLSVSGLHVGIVYVILGFLLKFLDKLRTRKSNYGIIIKAILLILFIWGFAMLSGLSPSVRRAAVMFSFFAFGQALNRPMNTINSLGASAFLLMLINPFLISDVGFQLSYIAVLFIVLYQTRLTNVLSFKRNWVKKLWELTAVSIVAQMGTTPISLYYFHIFPTWFLVSNLFIIFISTLIVYVAALLLFVSFIPFVSDWVAYALKYMVFAMNYMVEGVERLPYAAIENIYFDSVQMALWYGAILSVTSWLIFRQYRYLRFGLSMFVLIVGWSLWLNVSRHSENSLWVYNVKGGSVLQLNLGEQNVMFADTSVSQQDIEFGIKSNLLSIRNKHPKILSTDTTFQTSIFQKDSAFLQIFDRKMAIISDKKQVARTSSSKLKVDFVLVRNNPYLSMEEIDELYDTELVIFDSSNKQNRIDRWKEECSALGQSYFSVPDSGAFCFKLY